MSATAAAPAANTASIDQLRQNQLARVPEPADQMVDMFSERGFLLAQRIGKAFATSDAVPAQFRLQIEKKSRAGSTWIENPAALGNCLVAIETARAVGMSITAVMQQANVIEGRLTWSGKFIIAAINSSGRFTPLEFDMVNAGRIKAKYKEKLGWNEQKRGFDFAEREVEVDNWECRAFAYVMQNGRPTDKRIQGAKVSMKMAVEEGWYAKSGSKWQTEMYELMLQYRAGSFFGNIHAPDIVMGMGRTSEEIADTTVIEVDPDGTVTRVQPGEDLQQRRTPAAQAGAVTDVVQKNTVGATDEARPEQHAVDISAAASTATSAQADAPDTQVKAFDVDAFAEKLAGTKTSDELDSVFDTLRATSASDDEKAVLLDVYNRRAIEIDGGVVPAKAAPAATSRRARASSASME